MIIVDSISSKLSGFELPNIQSQNKKDKGRGDVKVRPVS